jgi:O-antigen ligase
VLILQVAAAGIIAWLAIGADGDLSRSQKQLLALLSASLLLLALQLVPLPPNVWTIFPGRQVFVDGYQALGQQLPWQAISLDPSATLSTFLFLLPPVAVAVLTIGQKAFNPTYVAIALIGGTAAAILLGYVQVITGQFGSSAWYMYDETNLGSAVGFFANRNHMGTLLLIAFPFVVALTLGKDWENARSASSMKILGAAGIILILLGLASNGSLAALILAVPVMAASAALLPALRRFSSALLLLSGVALLGSLVVLANSPVQAKLMGENTGSIVGRWELWNGTTGIVRDTLPLGTGIGTFQRVYGLGEEPAQVSSTYVNHAHNDYLEVIAETGVLGVLLLMAFFGWWLKQALSAARTAMQNKLAVAAAIASGAVLAHSLVDYPLRTTALATIFAFCLGLIATPRDGTRGREATGAGNTGHARHLNIG